MKGQIGIFDFVLKEWLLIATASGFALTSIYLQHLPVYSVQEFQVLFFLFALFVTVKGLERSGLILGISQAIRGGRALPLTLVLTTFFLSMVITNDVTLVVIVPLTLTLNIKRMDILVILEALAANAGSALTPFGNPQNLFIYWFYQLSPVEFIKTIAPLSLLFLILLAIASLAVGTSHPIMPRRRAEVHGRSPYIYVALFCIVILTILRVIPFYANLLVVLYVVLFDRRNLKVDYSLLITFFLLFGLAGNMQVLLAAELRKPEHIFLLSASASQVMSNVTATLLFAKFTAQWKALLWGSSVGGFGSLIGSMANLIAYRIYVSHEGTAQEGRFIVKFLTFGYLAFLIGIVLYFAVGLAH